MLLFTHGIDRGIGCSNYIQKTKNKGMVKMSKLLEKRKMYVVTTISNEKFCSMFLGFNQYLNSYIFKKGLLESDKFVSAITLEEYNTELAIKNKNIKLCVRCGGNGQYGKHGNCYLCGGIGYKQMI